jgi:hypothetical protein
MKSNSLEEGLLIRSSDVMVDSAGKLRLCGFVRTSASPFREGRLVIDDCRHVKHASFEHILWTKCF